MEFGCRAHDFGKLPPDESAARAAGAGFSSVQLAVSKALQGVDAGNGRLSPGLAARIGASFRARGVRIAVLGCYINPIHPDPAERRRHIDRFKEHLRFARDFGCSIVATETGSVNPDCSYHPDSASDASLAALVDAMAEIAAEAERFGVFACIEGVTTHVASSPLRLKAVLDLVGSNNLQVLFDPVNLISPDAVGAQRRMIDESFDLFGDRILAVHAKDFVLEDGRTRIVPPGAGCLDYNALFSLLAERKPGVDVILEDLRPDAMSGAIARLTEMRLGR
ncbi:MAG: sugar phosphate isomerase/epimerase family protein [Spirochaetaceae bacterium]|nr:sugar phosphate isomerase/epimerase family protein [Spirochaetaceae bacterium]